MEHVKGPELSGPPLCYTAVRQLPDASESARPSNCPSRPLAPSLFDFGFGVGARSSSSTTAALSSYVLWSTSPIAKSSFWTEPGPPIKFPTSERGVARRMDRGATVPAASSSVEWIRPTQINELVAQPSWSSLRPYQKS